MMHNVMWKAVLSSKSLRGWQDHHGHCWDEAAATSSIYQDGFSTTAYGLHQSGLQIPSWESKQIMAMLFSPAMNKQWMTDRPPPFPFHKQEIVDEMNCLT